MGLEISWALAEGLRTSQCKATGFGGPALSHLPSPLPCFCSVASDETLGLPELWFPAPYVQRAWGMEGAFQLQRWCLPREVLISDSLALTLGPCPGSTWLLPRPPRILSTWLPSSTGPQRPQSRVLESAWLVHFSHLQLHFSGPWCPHL